jgi:hypothetical protein
MTTNAAQVGLIPLGGSIFQVVLRGSFLTGVFLLRGASVFYFAARTRLRLDLLLTTHLHFHGTTPNFLNLPLLEYAIVREKLR